MTTAAVGAPGSPRRYLHSLWLLSARDLRVRYATSALGYLWSVLDPLVMSLIYWFVFTQVFGRGVGDEPYIVFLITALLPWVWFNAAVSDFTTGVQQGRPTGAVHGDPAFDLGQSHRAEQGDRVPLLAPGARAVRDRRRARQSAGASCGSRSPCCCRRCSSSASACWSPRCACCTPTWSARRKLILRALFYASPIIYGVADLPASFAELAAFNPLAASSRSTASGSSPTSGTRSASWSERS